MLKVEQATSQNELFNHLQADWEAKVKSYGDDPSSFAVPYLEHAQRIAAEPLPRKKHENHYGIYVLREDSGHFHGLFHANVAELPKTQGKTLRILWFLKPPPN
jgi:hypothetical protein